MSTPPSRAPLLGGGAATLGGDTRSDEGDRPIPVGDGVRDPFSTGNTESALSGSATYRLNQRCDTLDTNYAQVRKDITFTWGWQIVTNCIGLVLLVAVAAETLAVGWLWAAR